MNRCLGVHEWCVLTFLDRNLTKVLNALFIFMCGQRAMLKMWLWFCVSGFFFFSLRFDFTVWLEFSSDSYSCTEGDFDVCTNGIPSVIFRLAHKWPPSNTWTTLAVQSMQWTYYIMIILWYIYVYFVATSIMVSVNYCRSNRFSSFWLLFSLFSSHFSSFLLDTAVSAFITQNKRLKCLFTT